MPSAPVHSYASDFETTSADDYAIDGYTRVYLGGLMDIDTREYVDFDSIDWFYDWFQNLSCNAEVSFFNSSFDGSFIVNKCLREGMICESYMTKKEREDARKKARADYLASKGKKAVEWVDGKRRKTYVPKKVTAEFEEPSNSFSIIQSGSRWIQLVMKNARGFKLTVYDIGNHFTTCNNLEQVAEALGIPGKTDLDVFKRRGPDYIAGEEERIRCKRDVEIVAEAVKVMRDRGFTSSTLAGDAWRIWSDMYTQQVMREKDMDVKEAKAYIDKEIFPKISEKVKFSDGRVMDIRDAYIGGRVYLRPQYKDKDLIHVNCADRNGMYPAIMLNCQMPYGRPIISMHRPATDCYIVSFTSRFKLKRGMDPTLQKKGSFRSTQPEWLYESEMPMELTMTSIDLDLFLGHYDVYDWNVCTKYYVSFKTRIGREFFGEYIEGMAEWKSTAKEAMKKTEGTEEYFRHKADYYCAKVAQNALYGKTGQQPEKPYQWAELEEEKLKIRESDVLKGEFFAPFGHKYLPIACIITAEARKALINVYEKVKEAVYCDTDSVYYIDHGENLVDLGIELHPSKLGAWDMEHEGCEARFERAKTYVLRENGELIVRCGGMPVKVKEHVTWENFHPGVEFEAGTGKLLPRQVEGGKILIPISYKMSD